MSTTTFSDLSHLITHLLDTTLHIKLFPTRWHSIRSTLLSLSSSISSVPSSSSHPLLPTLLPSLFQTLTRLVTLSELCSDVSRPAPKLLTQSDLDMAAGWLTKQTHDLDTLIRSGVLNHSTAIVLSHPKSDSSKEEVVSFVRDLFARLQVGGGSFKKKSLESLVRLLKENEKLSGLVAEEGNVSYLIHLLDVNGGSSGTNMVDLAVTVVSALACGGDAPRKCVFEEGALGPLLRILEGGPTGSREKAVMAVEAIAGDADSAWALSAYGGVPALLSACRTGTSMMQAHAVGALRNAAEVREEVRAALIEEGAIPVLLHVLAAGDLAAQEKAADCIAVLVAADDMFKDLIKRENGLFSLLDVLRENPGSDVAEQVLRAIYALSSSDRESLRVLSSSTDFIIRIGNMITHGNILLQQISCLVLSNLSLSDGSKRVVAGCMPALLKLMESSKPDGMQEAAAAALSSLLTIRSNRKELVKDEKCLVRVVSMLDPKHDIVAKELAIVVTLAILAGGSEGCRKRLVGAGADVYLQRLTEMGIVGAKKVVQRLAGNRLKSLFSRTWRDLPGK